MSAIGTPVTPVQSVYQRAKTPIAQDWRPVSARPLSEATDILDTDAEEESDFEEYSPKGSFETVSTYFADPKHT